MRYTHSFRAPLFSSFFLSGALVVGYLYYTARQIEQEYRIEEVSLKPDLFFQAEGVSKKMYGEKGLACTLNSERCTLLLDTPYKEEHQNPQFIIDGEAQLRFQADRGYVNYSDKKISADLVFLSGEKAKHSFEGSSSSMQLLLDQSAIHLNGGVYFGVYDLFKVYATSASYFHENHCLRWQGDVHVLGETLFYPLSFASSDQLDIYLNDQLDDIERVQGEGKIYFSLFKSALNHSDEEIEIESDGEFVIDVINHTLAIYGGEHPVKITREGLYVYAHQANLVLIEESGDWTVETCRFQGDVVMFYAPYDFEPLQMGCADSVDVDFKNQLFVAHSDSTSRVLFVDQQSDVALSADKITFFFKDSLEAKGEGHVHFKLARKEWEKIKQQRHILR